MVARQVTFRVYRDSKSLAIKFKVDQMFSHSELTSGLQSYICWMMAPTATAMLRRE